jgi:hypothetical protein
MSDAAAVNGKKLAQTIDANCLAHGRGKFKELEEIFPVECGEVAFSCTHGIIRTAPLCALRRNDCSAVYGQRTFFSLEGTTKAIVSE